MEARLLDAATHGDVKSVLVILTSTDANVDSLDVSCRINAVSVDSCTVGIVAFFLGMIELSLCCPTSLPPLLKCYG